MLDKAAIMAARKCTFKPAIKDGKTVKVTMNIPFNFKLANKNGAASSDAVEGPILIKKEIPKYPKIAREKKIEGTVVVMVVVDKNGKVKGAKILNSIPELDEAAIIAANKCKFKPGLEDGKPVELAVTIPFNFKLPN